MKYLKLSSFPLFFFCMIVISCKSDSVPTEQFVLAQINQGIKPPLHYEDLKKIDEKRSTQMGEDVYWIKVNTRDSPSL